jgi:hypothetical protein
MRYFDESYSLVFKISKISSFISGGPQINNRENDYSDNLFEKNSLLIRPEKVFKLLKV